MPKPATRSARWLDAIGTARQGLEALKELQEEYQDWRDNLPENLDASPTAEKLDTIIDLDVDGALTTVEEAEGCDLPRGFGRD